MSVKTSLQRRILFQRLFMIVVCAVLGVWGLYDYVIKIPVNQTLVARGEVYREVRRSIEVAVSFPPGSVEARNAVLQGHGAIREALAPMLEAGRTDAGDTRLDSAKFMDQLRARNEEQWFQELLLMDVALQEVSMGLRESDGSMSAEFGVFVDEFLLPRVNATAAISPPSDFDRLIQWAFILCLPMVPWLAWALIRDSRGGYTLDDDGTLHYPGGSIGSDAVADIDMKRWMAKSIAEVVASDGRRVRLDDYIHRDTHRIVGAYAHRFYPDAWTTEAKEIRPAAAAAPSDEPAPTEAPSAASRSDREIASTDPAPDGAATTSGPGTDAR